MGYIILALSCVFAFSFALYMYGERKGSLAYAAHIFGIFFAGLGALASIFVLMSVFDWVAAGYRVDILNREHGTSYTQSEFFWAGDVINTTRIILQQIEANGHDMCPDAAPSGEL